MINQGFNEGFRMLDEFVCDAMPQAESPPADSPAQGQNEGMQCLEEMVVELQGEKSRAENSQELADCPSADQQAIARFHSAIDELPEKYRSVLVLRLNGLTLTDISKQLGLSYPVTKRRYNALVQKLKDQQ